jgi:hypothetical protein
MREKRQEMPTTRSQRHLGIGVELAGSPRSVRDVGFGDEIEISARSDDAMRGDRDASSIT